MSDVKRVAMIGATLWGNRGAEAMVAATVGRIRRSHPDARFALYSYLSAKDRELVRDKGVRVFDAAPASLVFVHFPFALLGWVLRTLRVPGWRKLLPAPVGELAGCDVLVDLMGVSFADGREKFLPFNILSNLPAMLLGVPVVRLSQAMGPFHHPLTRLGANVFLKRCRFIVARGSRTAEHLRELELPEHQWMEAADLAFLYEPEFSLTHENETRLRELTARLDDRRRSGRRVIGLCPSVVVEGKLRKRGQDYAGAMLRIIRIVLDRGDDVVILPNATREGSDQPRNNDLTLIHRLRERAAGLFSQDELGRIALLDFDANTAGIRQVIERCDALITSRFHAMIGALCLKTPVLVIGWSHKYQEVLAPFGLERFAIDFAELDTRLAPMLAEMMENLESTRAAIRAALPVAQASAADQFRVLDELLA